MTAQGKGTATITCTAKDGSGVKTTCKVTVNGVYVKSLSLDSVSCTIEEGCKTQLHAIIQPSNTTYYSLAWQSSNTSVATVDDTGCVTAVSVGTATITCKLNMSESSFFADPYEKIATCNITVTKKKEVSVTGISLSTNSISIKEGGTYKLSATIIPDNASNKAVSWSSGNTNIAIVNSNGFVTAVSQGTTTITCTAKDGSGTKATCSITVTKKEVTPTTIDFADAEVKRICVENWDTDGDGELSYAEAAAVSDLGTAFMNNLTIKTFEELRFFKGLTSICENAFYNCKSMTSINLPDCVSIIGNTAFRNCVNLTSIAIPNSVATIGGSVFMGCTGLTSVTIGNSVTYIEENTFYGCSSLTSVTIPNSVITIGDYAFYGCI